jgi:membrane-bound lytic murein transglycosylase A
MVAQDTGSAIIGPARADLYFGAGAEAGRVAGRLKNPMRFVILVPKSLDPVVRGHTMPLPDARPSAKIAKLFPQTDPLKADTKPAAAVIATAKDTAKPAPPVAAPPAAPAAPATVAQQTEPAKAIPLPEARPQLATDRPVQRSRHTRAHRFYRYHHYRHFRRWR